LAISEIFLSSKGDGAWPKWPSGKYAYARSASDVFMCKMKIGKIEVEIAVFYYGCLISCS